MTHAPVEATRFIGLGGPAVVSPPCRELIEIARRLGAAHAEAAAECDRSGEINTALVEDLRAAGYLTAAMPKEAGGGGHSLSEIVLAQAALAEYDASTALGVGMHLMVLGNEGWGTRWRPHDRERLFACARRPGALFNVLATEPQLGAPQRIERPATALTLDGPDRWLLRGRKSFGTFAERLSHAVVYASVDDGSDDVCLVLLPMSTPGVSVERTWDAIGMRATASHDVVFDAVPVDADDIVNRSSYRVLTKRPAMTPWFALPVAAVYLGIARAARNQAVEYARTRRPGGGARVADDPHVRELTGQMDADLMAAESTLLLAASAAGLELLASPRFDAIEPIEAAAKLVVTSTAIRVVDAAMRVAGGAALRQGLPLERCYRDVRSGPVHHPNDGRALAALAGHALDQLRQPVGIEGSRLFRILD